MFDIPANRCSRCQAPLRGLQLKCHDCERRSLSSQNCRRERHRPVGDSDPSPWQENAIRHMEDQGEQA
jgi:hypothetical protein